MILELDVPRMRKKNSIQEKKKKEGKYQAIYIFTC